MCIIKSLKIINVLHQYYVYGWPNLGALVTAERTQADVEEQVHTYICTTLTNHTTKPIVLGVGEGMQRVYTSVFHTESLLLRQADGGPDPIWGGKIIQ